MKRKELFIYDDFKMKKTLWSPRLRQKYFIILSVKDKNKDVFRFNLISYTCIFHKITSFFVHLGENFVWLDFISQGQQ